MDGTVNPIFPCVDSARLRTLSKTRSRLGVRNRRLAGRDFESIIDILRLIAKRAYPRSLGQRRRISAQIENPIGRIRPADSPAWRPAKVHPTDWAE